MMDIGQGIVENVLPALRAGDLDAVTDWISSAVTAPHEARAVLHGLSMTVAVAAETIGQRGNVPALLHGIDEDGDASAALALVLCAELWDMATADAVAGLILIRGPVFVGSVTASLIAVLGYVFDRMSDAQYSELVS